MFPKKRNPVYSTDPDFVPPHKRPKPAGRSLPPEQQTISIRRETKGRGGKTVTVAYDFQLSEEDLKTLAHTLKKMCGAGGAVKEGGTIEVQGDHREKIAQELKKLGYKTKFTGG